MPERRRGPPVGLQQKEHRRTGERYWAVVALDAMPSGGVRVLSPYSETWQRLRKNTLAVTFVDELEVSPPDLDGFTVHVTRKWLESHFREPTWQDFESSDCRLLGVTVGIMTGLLPAEGVPVRIGRGRPGAGSRMSRRRRQASRGLVGEALRRMLPFLLLNVVALAVMWWLPNYLQRLNRAIRAHS